MKKADARTSDGRRLAMKKADARSSEGRRLASKKAGARTSSRRRLAMKKADARTSERRTLAMKKADARTSKGRTLVTKKADARTSKGRRLAMKVADVRTSSGRRLAMKKADARTSKGRTSVMKKADARTSKGRRLSMKVADARTSSGRRLAMKKAEARTSKGRRSAAKKPGRRNRGAQRARISRCFANTKNGAQGRAFDAFRLRACAVCGAEALLSQIAFVGEKCGHCHRCPLERNKYVPHLPDDIVPDCLADLSFVEEMAISLRLPLMYLCSLKNGGQYGYRAHATVVEQDVGELARVLPRTSAELAAHVCTIRQGAREPGKECSEFKMRPTKVLEALSWLTANNPYYKGVDISVANASTFESAGGGCFYGYEIDVADPPQSSVAKPGVPAYSVAEPAVAASLFRPQQSPTNGDCFFATIANAMSRPDINVQTLRKIVSDNARQSDLDMYKLLHADAKAAIDDSRVVPRRKGRKQDRARRRCGAADANLLEFQFVDRVTDLAAFRAVLQTPEYWADHMAIETIQLRLGVKLIIFDEQWAVRQETKPEGVGFFAPTHYILTKYSGNAHYELLRSVESGQAIFTLAEALRGGVFRLAPPGTWALGFFSICSGLREALAQDATCDPTAASIVADSVANGVAPGVDDPRKLDHDEPTTSGIVIPEADELEVAKLRRGLETLAKQRAAAQNSPAGQPAEVVYDWPPQAPGIVNEHQDAGIFAQSFPKLFPFGNGDVTAAAAADGRRGPADKQLSLEEWAAYLFRHKCARFAQHPRFRYYVFNRINRQKASQISSVFHKKAGVDCQTVEDVDELLEGGDRSLSKRLQFWGASIRGSTSWKASRRGELMDMINTLGIPTFFITLSAADNHWRLLHDLVKQHCDQAGSGALPGDAGSNSRRVVDNPHMVSAFFVHRQAELLKSIYGDELLDFWGIYEWQSRGSVHLHGLMWMGDEPKCEKVEALLKLRRRLATAAAPDDADSSEAARAERELQKWCAYFDGYIHATNDAVIVPIGETYDSKYFSNPAVEVLPRLEKHVCQYLEGELAPEQDMKYLVNFCNRHIKCRAGVCLKRGKDGAERCKNGAPWPSSECSHIAKDPTTGRDTFVPRRNDPLLNNVPSRHFVRWRANSDLKPVLSHWALVMYLTKYLTKRELPSDDLKSAARAVLSRAGSDASAAAVYAKALNRTHNRDYSAQEVVHHVLKLPGHHCTRQFQVASMARELDMENGNTKPSTYHAYLARTSHARTETAKAEVPHLSFFQWVERYQIRPPFSRRQKDVIPRIFPAKFCTSRSDASKFAEWCQYQLLCHLPHTDPSALSEVARPADRVQQLVGQAVESQEMGLRRLSREWALINAADDEEEPDSESDCTSVSDSSGPEMIPDFGAAGAPNAGAPQAGSNFQFADDWTARFSQVGEATAADMRDFVRKQKLEAGDDSHDVDLTKFEARLLNPEQREFYSWLKEAAAATSSGASPIRAVVRGGGGVGKSYAINCFRRWLQESPEAQAGADSLLLMAPTGTAAFNICGATLHSTLRLPVPLTEHSLQPLAKESLQRLQDAVRQVRVVVIDEVSMVGRRMLAAIDSRLRQATATPSQYFGGLSVFLCGDFGQLPPIGDLPMFSTQQKGGALSAKGRRIFQACNRSLELKQNERQSDKDLQRALWKLRCGELDESNYNLFASRGRRNCSRDDVGSFQDASMLVSTRNEEQEYNLSKLKELARPVFRVEATHTGGKKAKLATEKQVALARTAMLAVGAKVMLRTNAWTSRGLTNGSQGIFVDLAASETNAMPYCALVRFPWYAGPPFFPDDPHLVPIPPHTVHFGNGNAQSRTQLPLCLSWAITIHKSQGQTYDKVIISLGDKEIALGLAYVALSRCKSLDGMLLTGNYTYGRLMRLNENEKHRERTLAEKWLDSLSPIVRKRGRR